MAAIIRRMRELPEWFSAEKYMKVPELDLTGWYEQLYLRRNLQILTSKKDWSPLRADGILDLLIAIRACPIVDVSSTEELRAHFYGGALHELKQQNPNYAKGVRPATVHDLYAAEWNLHAPVMAHAKAYYDSFFGGDWGNAQRIGPRAYMHEPINCVSGSRHSELICVNTLLPDSILIEQFKQLLAIRRSSSAECIDMQPGNRKIDTSSWVTFGVLPFLDLRLWARIEGVKIPNRVMADAIFPAGEGGEEVVRKTTKKLADYAISDENLQELASSAAFKITEQHSG